MGDKEWCPRFNFCNMRGNGCNDQEWLGCDLYVLVKTTTDDFLKNIGSILRERDFQEQIGLYRHEENWYRDSMERMKKIRITEGEFQKLEREIDLVVKEFLLQRRKKYI